MSDSHNKLQLNAGTFIHLTRDTEEMYLDGHDTTPYEQYNPMGLRHVETVLMYAEEGYGVSDLYVFKDNQHQLWGITMYRGLGKYDENYQILEIADQIGSLDLDPTVTEDWEPLELVALNRKATYRYEVR